MGSLQQFKRRILLRSRKILHETLQD